MKTVQLKLSSLLLCLFLSASSFAQVDVTWLPDNVLNSSLDVTTIDDQVIYCQKLQTWPQWPHAAVSQNILNGCRNGSITADFKIGTGGGLCTTPTNPRAWVLAIDEDGAKPYDYAILVKENGSNYDVVTGTGLNYIASNPNVVSWVSSTSHATSYSLGDPFIIQRTFDPANNDFLIEILLNGSSIDNFTNQPIADLKAVVIIDEPSAYIDNISATFLGSTCGLGAEDWKGGATGTMTPVSAADNILIPARLGVGPGSLIGSSQLNVVGDASISDRLSIGNIPDMPTPNFALVTDASGVVSRQNINSITDLDWSLQAGGLPQTLTDNIYTLGTVGVGTNANQGILHVRDASCDNFPALRVTGDGDLGCTEPDQHGPLIYAESFDFSGSVLLPRFEVTQQGRVGIGMAATGYQLDVAGAARNTTGFWNVSDQRFKKSVRPVTGGLDLISQINGVSYEFRISEFPEKNFMDGRHFGFIAQDLQKVVPEAVHEGEDGYLAVNYSALVPILTEAIKEQQKQIDILSSQLELISQKTDQSQPKGSGAFDGNEGDILNLKGKLYQNTPNPFDENTTVHYYLPEGTVQAQLIIFDMSGKQLIKEELVGSGQGSINLSLGDWGAGMYLYSLVANNKEIDTKRMIITD